jgi:hypothetical protein
LIGCALIALGPLAAAGTAAAARGATAPAVKLQAGGKGLDVVSEGTEVKIVATVTGTVPRDQRPATIELLGGYAVRGQTQAHALRRCSQMRCEIDPTIRTETTWTYQAFLLGKGGMLLAKSRIVKVEWIRQGPRAIAL